MQQRHRLSTEDFRSPPRSSKCSRAAGTSLKVVQPAPSSPGPLVDTTTLRNRWATSLNCMEVWQSTGLKLKGTKTRVFGTNANDPQLELRSGLPSMWGHWPVLVTLNVGLGNQHSTFARDSRGWKFQLHVEKGRTGAHRLLQLSGINM